jgi:hypothetical protein
LRGEEKRPMSPIAAMKVAAVSTLTAGDAHQPQHLRPSECCSGDLAIESGDLVVEEVDLAQTIVEGQALVDWKLQTREPAAATCRRRQ